MIRGIDVSEHQGAIDWAAVKQGGVQFAVVRAGWTHYEGGLTCDDRFCENSKGAARAGIPTGVYAYGYDLSPEAAKISAKKLIEAIEGCRLEYPVCYDQEYEPRVLALSRQVRTDICKAFLETVQDAGYYAMLYASKDWLENRVYDEQLTGVDKWVAQYASACTYSGSYGIWQHGVIGSQGVKGKAYTISGRVEGVNANCDVNFAYQDYPAIIKKAGLNHLGKGQEAAEPDYRALWRAAKNEISTLRPKAEKYDQIAKIIEQ